MIKLRKVYCGVCQWFFELVNIWQTYKQEHGCLVDFLRLLAVYWPGAQSVRDNHVFCQIFTELIFFSDRLGSKPFLIWLLKTSLHLKYIATLPGNFSLIACFVTLMFDKIVWQHIRGVVGYINHFTTYLPRNLSEKIFWKSVKIWQNYSHEFVASIFLAHTAI